MNSQQLKKLGHKLTTYRMVNLLLALFSLIGMSYAMILQKVMFLMPCPLCVFQRVGLIGMGLFAFIAFVWNPRGKLSSRLALLPALASILWSLGVAGRHVWLQHLPADQVPSCGTGLNYLLETFPIMDVIRDVLTGSGECAEVVWTLAGLSIPEQSLLFFLALSAVLIWQIARGNARSL